VSKVLFISTNFSLNGFLLLKSIKKIMNMKNKCKNKTFGKLFI